MLVGIVQTNPTIGDLSHNVDALLRSYERARDAGADLVVAPELAVTGYPPRDLLDRPAFVRDAMAAAQDVVAQVRGAALVFGAVVSHEGEPWSSIGRLGNGAIAAADGEVLACHRKLLLPNYDVFDEARHFTPGKEPTLFVWRGVRVGLAICEDLWNDKQYWREPRYERDPVRELVDRGAELVLSLNASPYDRDKPRERAVMLGAMAKRYGRAFVYVNQVGGNDGLIFDGRSFAMNAQGELTACLPAFSTAEQVLDSNAPAPRPALGVEPATWEADALEALTLGLADYSRKCGFTRAVLGLSGGIDSALTAAIAVRALGADAVLGVAMPSRYSSAGSLDDARELGRRLGIRVDELSIETVFAAYLETLATPFAGLPADLTEENLQARIRGALLMAYSNKLGALLLTTGNKSEVAVGYCTLYGDMCGGLAVISDVYKTDVYDLARYLNLAHGAPIPQNSIDKAPSAELRPNQRDDDSLPPYPLLDQILRGYVDEHRPEDELVGRGASAELVARVARMVDRAEYKRRQMPPGLRISRKAFGEGRRLPIAQRYVPRK